jgi:hypothetical protein
MKTIKETIPEIIAELEQEQALERNQILEYRKRISEAWRREKVRVNVQTFRAKKRSSVITDVITPMITSVITSDKEERTEKENLPPTPPIREKGKKEEMPPAAATRASRVRGECPSWEQVKERAEVSLKCRDFDRLLPIVEQIVKNGCNRKESITQLAIKRRISKPSAERKYFRGGQDPADIHFTQ